MTPQFLLMTFTMFLVCVELSCHFLLLCSLIDIRCNTSCKQNKCYHKLCRLGLEHKSLFNADKLQTIARKCIVFNRSQIIVKFFSKLKLYETKFTRDISVCQFQPLSQFLAQYNEKCSIIFSTNHEINSHI